MKNTIVFTAIFFFAVISSSAQPTDTARVLVYYKFSWVRDTTDRAHPWTNDMVLQVGKRFSIYKTSVETGLKSGGPQYFQFFRDGKLQRKDPILMSQFQVNETMPLINWQISSDTASFGGLHCQKATTRFKGREYTAWFCPDLPLPAGPLKLNGLPGVIVQACDAKKEVCIIFDHIERPQPNNPTILHGPRDATIVTEKELAKLQETFRKDPDAFIKLISGGGAGPKIDIKPGPMPVINNPIELTGQP